MLELLFRNLRVGSVSGSASQLQRTKNTGKVRPWVHKPFQKERIPIGSMGVVYLPTFAIWLVFMVFMLGKYTVRPMECCGNSLPLPGFGLSKIGFCFALKRRKNPDDKLYITGFFFVGETTTILDNHPKNMGLSCYITVAANWMESMRLPFYMYTLEN